MVRRILLPIMLVLVALLSAAALAWGTHPDWARYQSGLSWIMMARQLQWPLATLSILCCIVLIGMAVSGRRRVWWLAALAPVVVLFYQRFAGEPFRRMEILDQPQFVAARQADFLYDEAPVVGLTFEGTPYAYAVASLNRAPVVLHADADQRMMLMWNPYAGRAVAWRVEHTVKPREIDIVSMPANAMLLFNARIGQFINAFTGLTPAGERPSGFIEPVVTHKTTWRRWRIEHPETLALRAPLGAGELPRQPFAHRPIKLHAPEVEASLRTPVALLGTPRPAILLAEQAGPGPLNITAGGANLLLVRDREGRLMAFDRAVNKDLFPTFQKRKIPRKPEVAMVDSDTNSLWSIDGRCLEGYARGERLRAVAIEADLPLGVLASYYADLEWVSLSDPQPGR